MGDVQGEAWRTEIEAIRERRKKDKDNEAASRALRAVVLGRPSLDERHKALEHIRTAFPRIRLPILAPGEIWAGISESDAMETGLRLLGSASQEDVLWGVQILHHFATPTNASRLVMPVIAALKTPSETIYLNASTLFERLVELDSRSAEQALPLLWGSKSRRLQLTAVGLLKTPLGRRHLGSQLDNIFDAILGSTKKKTEPWPKITPFFEQMIWGVRHTGEWAEPTVEETEAIAHFFRRILESQQILDHALDPRENSLDALEAVLNSFEEARVSPGVLRPLRCVLDEMGADRRMHQHLGRGESLLWRKRHEAIATFYAGIATWHSLPDKLRDSRDLARCYRGVGNAYREVADRGKSLAAYIQAREILSITERTDANVLDELDVRCALATMLSEMNDTSGAIREYEDACRIVSRNLSKLRWPAPFAQRHSFMAEHFLKLGRRDVALRSLREAQQLLEIAAAMEPGDPNFPRWLDAYRARVSSIRDAAPD